MSRKLAPGECPRCGFRGWYEGEDADKYCEEPGCTHADRVKEYDNVYYVFKHADDLLKNGKFEELRLEIASLNLREMPISVITSWAAVSHWKWREFFEDDPHPIFLKRCKEEVIRREGEARIEGLFGGLE